MGPSRDCTRRLSSSPTLRSTQEQTGPLLRVYLLPCVAAIPEPAVFSGGPCLISRSAASSGRIILVIDVK